MPTQQAGRRTRPSDRRDQVLAQLRRSRRPLTIAEIAERIDVHVNTVRFHLSALVDRGQVVQVDAARSGPGRPPQRYAVAPGMDPTGPRQYLALAQTLVTLVAALPRPRQRALAAGRRWGRELAASGSVRVARSKAPEAALMTMLDDLGFAPERRRADGESFIALRHCPFLELSESSTDVVCPIHLGLMQGAAEQWRSAVTVDTLDSFVQPDVCLAHLTATGASDGRRGPH